MLFGKNCCDADHSLWFYRFCYLYYFNLIIEVAKAKNTISERRICITKFLFAASVYIVQTIWAIIMFYLLNNLLSIIETSPSAWHFSFLSWIGFIINDNGLDLFSIQHQFVLALDSSCKCTFYFLFNCCVPS